MALILPEQLKYLEQFFQIVALVWDGRSGGDIKILLRATDGSIVPKGRWALFVIELQDGRLLVGHTTKFNEAPDGQFTHDNGAWLAFSQYPNKIYRPTEGHSYDIIRCTSGGYPVFGWGWGSVGFSWGCWSSGGCLWIGEDGTCGVNPDISYEPGFSAIAQTRIQRLRVWVTGPVTGGAPQPIPSLAAAEKAAAEKASAEKAAAEKAQKAAAEKAAEEKAQKAAAEKASAEKTAADKTVKVIIDDDGAMIGDSSGHGTSVRPEKSCFKRAPDLPLNDAIAACMSLKETPPGRPDLEKLIPDDDDFADLLSKLDEQLPIVKARSSVQALILTNGLTDEDIKVLILYKLENPYPMYRWFNGWLQSNRRDASVVNNIGPLFKLLYRAQEKLERETKKAARSVIVGQIPGLRATFDNHTIRLAPDQPLCFWSFSSFSTDDKVINSPNFIGGPKDDAIVYQCAKVVGVNMEPFKPVGMPPEDEILPLCPAVFKVIVATMIGCKLSVTLEQEPHEKYAYVPPAKKMGPV